jgi:hypothetical protein
MKAIMAAVKQRGIKVGKTKGDSTRRFPPAVNRQAPERGRREPKREDATSLRSFGSRSRRANRIASSPNEFNETGVVPARQSKWTTNAIWKIASLMASEFRSSPEVVAATRVGVAQLKVRQRVDEIGPLLLTWRGEGWSYRVIASELRRRGIDSPWGGDWGQASIGRYLKRAMGVSALKPTGEAAK